MAWFMQFLLALMLAACSAAQVSSSSRSTTRTSTTAVRSFTSAAAAATSTRTPCGRIAYSDGGTAEVAYNCLTSVPFKKAQALDTVQQLKKFAEFQSTLVTLKNPPSGYVNPPVDILALLDNTISKVNGDGFANQYEFEQELVNITIQSYDGHFTFHGMTFMGAIRWRRGAGTSAALVSMSSDGSALPQIYLASDIRGRANSPSPVTQINGMDVLDFLQQESTHQQFHDPDTRFNVMFARYAAESSGSFIYPWFYPGANTTMTFGNGTRRTFTNYGLVPTDVDWDGVIDGETFYDLLVNGTGTSSYYKSKMTRTVKRSVPSGYPSPVVVHSDYDVNLGGFYLSGSDYSDIAVLSINTFNWDSTSDGREFQTKIGNFLSQASSQGKKKLIVDVSSNGGGVLLSGYDTFKQFFPKLEPDIGARMRRSDALDVLGSQFGTITTYQPYNNTGYIDDYLTASSIYRSSIHYADNVDINGQNFSSWQDMAGPVNSNGDNFTKTMRNNFSNPLLFSPLVMSGYGSRSSISQYFPAENIVLLHDGYCGSTCAIFSDLMRREGGVKSYVLGGRPQYGPMQPVGGTRGALELPYTTLMAYVDTVLGDFGTASDKQKWADFLPHEFPIQTYSTPSVNFRDGLHPGSDTPMQYLNETANCRFFYTAAMLQNVTNIWQTVAETAFLGNDHCVSGSVTNGSEVDTNPPTSLGGTSSGGTSNPGGSGTSGASNPSGTQTSPSPTNSGAGTAVSGGSGGIWCLLSFCLMIALVNL